MGVNTISSIVNWLHEQFAHYFIPCVSQVDVGHEGDLSRDRGRC